jgi:integrase
MESVDVLMQDKKKCAATTIRFVVGMVRQIRASVVDEHGNEVYPYTWNAKFLKLPKARKRDMNRPSITPGIMSGLAKIANTYYRVLFILMGATGMRIAEMLAVEIDKHVSADFRTLTINQQVHRGQVEDWTKTESGTRQVDLYPAVSDILKWFVGDRKSGFLFPGSWPGRPLGYSTVIFQLKKELKRLGYKNDFDECLSAATHIFRRFRITYLRNRAFCPPGVRRFWLGHADDDERERDEMAGWYDTSNQDRELRLEAAEKCGLGFDLPNDVPNAPKFPTLRRRLSKPRKRKRSQRVNQTFHVEKGGGS